MRHFEDLERALLAEVDLLEQAVALAERKRQTLVENDLPALEALLPEEEAMALCLKQAEFSLTGTIGILAGQVGADSLAELIAARECQNSRILEPLYQQMIVRLAGLQQANEQNRLLIEQSLAFVDFSLKLLTSSANDPAYNAAGRAVEQRTARLVDRKL